jgi:pimeloyl-ACP methyl ester carboxylesterase
MEQPFFRLLAEGLTEEGYAVLRFDATNGIGESEGDIYNCTVTGYLQDGAAVLDYANRQPSLDFSRLAIFGTSMGGLVATLLAERDARVRFLIPHSPALNWHILKEHPDLTGWQEGEWLEFISKSKGKRFKVGFDLYTDGLQYDAYRELSKLKIPKLFLHSEKDEAIPLAFSQKAYRLASPPKKLIVVPGATHNPSEVEVIQRFVREMTLFLEGPTTPKI